MPKPFDATTKTLVEISPRDWPILFGLPAGETRLVDADTSTVSGSADKVLRVTGPPDWIMHVEFQSGPDADLPQRMDLDNALLEDRHGLAVQSAVVLLAPKANLRTITGLRECRFRGQTYRTFRDHVIRVWEQPADQFLQGGPSLLPLATISAARRDQLPGVVSRMKDRLSELPTTEAARLWTAASILMGLRYSESFAAQLLEGVIAMEESTTYQAIIRKGRLEEGRRILLLLGSDRFGPTDEQVTLAVQAIDKVERLEELTRNVSRVATWQELLEQTGSPRSRRRNRT